MRLPTAAMTAAKETADTRCTAAGGAFRSKAGHCARTASAAAASVAQLPLCAPLLSAPACGTHVAVKADVGDRPGERLRVHLSRLLTCWRSCFFSWLTLDSCPHDTGGQVMRTHQSFAPFSGDRNWSVVAARSPSAAAVPSAAAGAVCSCGGLRSAQSRRTVEHRDAGQAPRDGRMQRPALERRRRAAVVRAGTFPLQHAIVVVACNSTAQFDDRTADGHCLQLYSI